MNSLIVSVRVTAVISLLFIEGCSSSIGVDATTGEDIEDCWRDLLPCQTLDFALQGAQYNDSSQIVLSEGTYHLSNNESISLFVDKTSFAIKGVTDTNVTIHCDDGAGLSFINSSNIVFMNVNFIRCGFLHNSTSTNTTDNFNGMRYLEFRAGIYFLFCFDVTFENVTVTNSTGTGVVFYSTYGQVFISLSNFTYNSAIGQPGGGGVAVEFVYCAPGDVDCNDTKGSDIPIAHNESTYTFSNCHFSYNKGTTSSLSGDSFIVPFANHNVALGRGAGLTLLFKGNASNNTLSVIGCTLEGNSAVWGGAMLIEFQDDTHDNTVNVNSTVIANNNCYYNSCTYEGTGGGGVRVQFAGFKETVKGNSVHFISTHFINNKAYFGGGVSFLTFPTLSDKSSNLISFVNCTWHNNTARLGSAIDLSFNATVSGSIVTKPEFCNCIFDSNTVKYTEGTGVPVGVGTIYTDLVPILFKGLNKFIRNNGSGIASLDAALEFEINSTAEFIGNSARSGAGVILFNKAFIKIGEKSHLKFVNNTASFYGGGIYWKAIGDHQLISSRNCFIRYRDSLGSMNILPSQWKAKMEFRNNKAVLSGHAIYATTLLSCVWGGQAYGHLVDPKDIYRKVFCWNSNIWDYGSDDCNGDTNNSLIATAPGYYANKNNELLCGVSSYFSFDIVPGKQFLLQVFTMDDRQNRVPLNDVVFSYQMNSTYNDFTKYTTYESTSYAGYEFEKAVLHLETTVSRIISTEVVFNFNSCPPGYLFDEIQGSCVVANYTFVKAGSNYKSYIQFGYWMGQNGSSDDLYVSQCLYCPWNPNVTVFTNYVPLASDVSDLNEYFCGALYRKGVTCSDCIDGYGVAVNSDKYKCIPCSINHKSYSWLLYIIFEYGTITVLLIFIIIFNISFTAGPANAFIFFAQIISTTFGVDAGGSINYQSISPIASAFKQFYITAYGIWNLNFFISIDYDGWLFCLGPDINALHIITLRYIAALYPLVVFIIIVFLIHLYDNNYRVVTYAFRPFRKLSSHFYRLNLQRSIMHTFATFIILSYVKFVMTSCYLLYPSSLEDSSGEVCEYISLYNGNIKFKSLEYAPYLISSLVIIGLCVALPFILFLYSIKPFYSCLERYNCQRLQPGIKLQHFLNSFHQCFKDGLNGEHDCRYFAAVYFYLKLALISAYTLGFDWMKQYIIQQAICTIAIFMVGAWLPYKKMIYNFLDLAMFSLLAVINVCTIYNRYLLAVDRSLSEVSFYIQVILIIVPLVYYIGYIVFFRFQSCWKKPHQHYIEHHTHPGNPGYMSVQTETDVEPITEVPREDEGQVLPFIISKRLVSTEPARYRQGNY